MNAIESLKQISLNADYESEKCENFSPFSRFSLEQDCEMARDVVVSKKKGC